MKKFLGIVAIVGIGILIYSQYKKSQKKQAEVKLTVTKK